MKRYFLFKDDSSHKFWEIHVENNKHIIFFGRVGSTGTTKEKAFADNASCHSDSLKLIKEKLKKGYVEIDKSLKIDDAISETTNDKILHYLTVLLESNTQKFKSYSSVLPLITELFNSLQIFDWDLYKTQVTEEIKKNFDEWWTNPQKGIIDEVALFSILFEYDYYLQKDVHARAYGIVEWEDFKPHTKSFDMGYEYDFANGFEAVPGITLNFFDNLEVLYWENLPETIDAGELFYAEGYQEMIKCYVYNGLIALHKVFADLDNQKLFDKINKRRGFMFLVGEHDTGEVFPIYVP
ncbi:MAG: WGR domain-containing protein [Emticicia sp.]|uniref:WGR domain-containing protein n=1 Tax=Emticicia sp. TaxID=1930953 RepID=UPI003BA7CBBB